MAYRLEKTNIGVDIVFDGWENGIAQDPFSGIADMRQVNISTLPKTVQVGYGITVSTTSGGTLGKPISKATRFTSYLSYTGTGGALGYLILDDSGQVWESTTLTGTWTFLSNNNTTTNHNSNDAIWFWKGFLFKTRGVNIDYYNGTIWVNAWKTSLVSDTSHKAITPINDKVYFCNGTAVGSLTEITLNAFDPTNTATYTLNTATFQLPSYDIAQSIAQLGSGTSNSTITILVGGSQNIIYPFLTSGTSFQTPIYIADYFIKNMVSVNQSVYIFPGNVQGRGRIYISNSVQAQLFFKIPDSITGYDDPYYTWGDIIFHRNNLVFGFFANKNDGSGAIISMADVWALDLDSKAYRSISSLSTNAGYANATVLIPDQSNSAGSGFAYIVGYTDNNSTNAIGRSSTTSGVGISVIKTDQVPVGTYFNKYTFNSAEVKLQTPLASGESIDLIGYSDNVSAGTTFSLTTVGAISGQTSASFEGSQWLQFQLTLIGNSQTSGCRLKEIRVHGIPTQ